MKNIIKINILPWVPAITVIVAIIIYKLLYLISPTLVCYKVNPPDGKEMICGLSTNGNITAVILKSTFIIAYIGSIILMVKKKLNTLGKLGAFISTALFIVYLYLTFSIGETDVP